MSQKDLVRKINDLLNVNSYATAREALAEVVRQRKVEDEEQEVSIFTIEPKHYDYKEDVSNKEMSDFAKGVLVEAKRHFGKFSYHDVVKLRDILLGVAQNCMDIVIEESPSKDE